MPCFAVNTRILYTNLYYFVHDERILGDFQVISLFLLHLFTCVCTCMHVCTEIDTRGQHTEVSSLLFTTWVSEINLKSPGLETSKLNYLDVSTKPSFYLLIILPFSSQIPLNTGSEIFC